MYPDKIQLKGANNAEISLKQVKMSQNNKLKHKYKLVKINFKSFKINLK